MTVRTCFAAGFFLLFALPVLCHGQEFDEDEAAAEEAVAVAGAWEIDVANFDQWIFNSSGNTISPLGQLEVSLDLQMDFLERTCTLTDEQRKKLRLAATGDVERFLHQLERTRAHFMLVRRDQQRFNEIWQEIQPLQQQVQSGLFGRGSLFNKVLEATLSESQYAEYQRVDLERRRYRFQARIMLALEQLDMTMPMTDEQRTALTERLLKFEPPRYISMEYDHYVTLAMLARIPEKQLKEILDPTQMAVLRQHLRQGRALEQFLKQNGAELPEVDDADERLPDDWPQVLP